MISTFPSSVDRLIKLEKKHTRAVLGRPMPPESELTRPPPGPAYLQFGHEHGTGSTECKCAATNNICPVLFPNCRIWGARTNCCLQKVGTNHYFPDARSICCADSVITFQTRKNFLKIQKFPAGVDPQPKCLIIGAGSSELCRTQLLCNTTSTATG